MILGLEPKDLALVVLAALGLASTGLGIVGTYIKARTELRKLTVQHEQNMKAAEEARKTSFDTHMQQAQTESLRQTSGLIEENRVANKSFRQAAQDAARNAQELDIALTTIEGRDSVIQHLEQALKDSQQANKDTKLVLSQAIEQIEKSARESTSASAHLEFVRGELGGLRDTVTKQQGDLDVYSQRLSEMVQEVLFARQEKQHLEQQLGEERLTRSETEKEKRNLLGMIEALNQRIERLESENARLREEIEKLKDINQEEREKTA